MVDTCYRKDLPLPYEYPASSPSKNLASIHILYLLHFPSIQAENEVHLNQRILTTENEEYAASGSIKFVEGCTDASFVQLKFPHGILS
jgi:hypothetical protein